jgi:hypothetical protein
VSIKTGFLSSEVEAEKIFLMLEPS